MYFTCTAFSSSPRTSFCASSAVARKKYACKTKMGAERAPWTGEDALTKASLLFLHDLLLFLESRDAVLQALVHRRRVYGRGVCLLFGLAVRGGGGGGWMQLARRSGWWGRGGARRRWLDRRPW